MCRFEKPEDALWVKLGLLGLRRLDRRWIWPVTFEEMLKDSQTIRAQWDSIVAWWNLRGVKFVASALEGFAGDSAFRKCCVSHFEVSMVATARVPRGPLSPCWLRNFITPV